MMDNTNNKSSEIERKFLIHDPGCDLEEYPSVKIRQGYLVAEDRVELRVREEGTDCFLTFKKGQGEDRLEAEIPISREKFADFWPLTRGQRVRKQRYRVPCGDHTAEVDVYRRKLRGLITAEVEFPNQEAASAFHPPDWLGLEITGDERYANQNLARHGIPEEAAAAVG